MRKSYIWATAITVGLGLWMASPYLMGAPATEVTDKASDAAVAEKLFKVRVKTFTAIPRVAVVTANGVTAASKRVDARARNGNGEGGIDRIIGSDHQRGRPHCPGRAG